MMKPKNLDKNWFGEKTDQVEPNSITAFGIKCSSRYSKARELTDMLNFCEECTRKGVNIYITRLFYDSKSCLCNIDYDNDQARKDHVQDIIRDIADNTLEQHDMDGYIGGYCNKKI